MKIRSILLAAAVVSMTACESDQLINENDTLQSESFVSNSDEVSRVAYTPIQGRYIVVLKKGTFDAPINLDQIGDVSKKKEMYLNQITELKRALTNSNASLSNQNIAFGFDGEKIQSVFRYGLEGFVADLSEDEAKALANHPNVESVSKDYLLALKGPKGGPNAGGGGGTTSGQTIPWGITRVGGAGDGTGKTAWVVDSGIDLDHPDLNVDLARSLSFAGDNNPDDGNGHGTHVAGTIAAKNNSIGVVGVAANANVVACKVLSSSGSGDFSWTVQALDYIAAVGQAGDVVNMSLGPDAPYIHPASDTATQNVASKGIKIAIAAGNSYDNANLYTPARNNHPNIYTISASTENDFFAYFSNYGTCVDYAAPGYEVNSTYPGGGYAVLSGTSMASPHAAGILLLGNPVSDGNVKNGYWEIKGSSLSGKISETDVYKRSTYRYDKDGAQDPIMHR